MNLRQVTVQVPAKVNVSLAVGPSGDDGFHGLMTIFQAVSLYDLVTVQEAPADQISVSGLHADRVPLDDSNLAMRAIELLRQSTPLRSAVKIHIQKHIPVAGGMAGGSADAAGALVAANVLWSLGLSNAQLHEHACALGSDVPFALMGHTALGLGRGVDLTPVLTRSKFHWVFATFATGVSTPEVFATFDERCHPSSLQVPQEALAALASGDPYRLGQRLRNDLEAATFALAPYVQDAKAVANEAESLGVIVSGSGPTVAALAASNEHALKISRSLEQVADATFIAYGPVAGAREVI